MKLAHDPRTVANLPYTWRRGCLTVHDVHA
jgi:hypothetical protein